MNATEFFVQQKLRHSVSQIERSIVLAAQARNFSELVRAISHTPSDPMVRNLPQCRSAKIGLKNQAEQRAGVLLKELLAAHSSGTPADTRALHEAYHYCCGHLPREATVISQTLLSRRRPPVSQQSEA